MTSNVEAIKLVALIAKMVRCCCYCCRYITKKTTGK